MSLANEERNRMAKLLTTIGMCIAFVTIAGLAVYKFSGDTAKQDEQASIGATPKLPIANPPFIPTVNIAPAIGWQTGQMPKPHSELQVNAFATGLNHPRWIFILPNHDVLVAETNAPPKPEDGKGVKGWTMKMVMAWAGAAPPSANRILLLRDQDNDGVAESRFVFIAGLNSPFGMTLIGNELFVANTDAVLRFPYQDGETEITIQGTKLADLPAGPLNHHWTKGLLSSADGHYLYASVGSNSNVAENGIDKEINRAAIHEIEVATGKTRILASGLRNPVGMALEPQSKQLWAVVNERDELGSDLVPDYLTSVKDGGFYGWPYTYYGQNIDSRVSPAQPALVASAIVPDYALGNHVAPLGLAFAEGNALADSFKSGAFVGEHGSWNRNPLSGYKVVFIPFDKGKPSGYPIDVLTGFLDADQNALGRPVGVAFDQRGALLVADDVGNAIWRLSSATEQTSVAQ
jgi:glucose/arabinose dehydrogenase